MKTRYYCLILIFLTLSEVVSAQNFSKTYKDTMDLNSLAGNPLEVDSFYFVANGGIGLTLEEGGYAQIVKLSKTGDVVKRLLNHKPDRRNSGTPPIALLNDTVLIFASGEQGFNAPQSQQGFTIVALNLDLDTLWRIRAPDSIQFDVPTSIICTNNKIYIIGLRNYIDSPGEFFVYDGLLLILNEDGSFVDFKTIQREDGDVVLYSALSVNGEIYLGGNLFVEGGLSNNKGYIAKTDEWGNILWDTTYPGFYETCSISRFDENHMVLSGIQYDGVNIPCSKVNVLKFNGELIWTRTYSFIGTQNPYQNFITYDNGVVLVGLTTVDAQAEGNAGYVMKADSLGNVLWQRRYNYNRFTDFFQSGIETSDHSILISGSARDTAIDGGGQNLWVVKLDSMGCLEPDCWVGFESANTNELGISVYPNPTTDWLNFKLNSSSEPITLELFSISGSLVMKINLVAHLESIQVSHLQPGIYLAKFTDKSGSIIIDKIIISH
ncbi:MAG: T9SS type A sorting domain-containing protein [Bacteroidia bacterium]